MKSIKNIAMMMMLMLAFASCKKDYYLDSGVHVGQFDGNIIDYLNTKPEYFDTLVSVIELAGLTDKVKEGNITFFAPPNGSITKSVRALNRYLQRDGKDTVSQLRQIKQEVWQELLSMYIIEGKYGLKDIPQLDTLDLEAYSGQSYESLAGRPMVAGVIYNNAGGVKYSGYRQLWYSYIRDYSNPKLARINIPVATSNIEPINSFIHVLAFKFHTFGFATDSFILKTTSKGIDPAN